MIFLDDGTNTPGVQSLSYMKYRTQIKQKWRVNPGISPCGNLKSYLSSAISGVIRPLENLSTCGNDRNQLDYSLYKLEQIVCAVKTFGGIF